MSSWASPAQLSRILFVAACGPIVLLGLQVWPAADDFGYWNLARSSGSPLAFASQMYETWSGRLFTHFLNGLVFSRPDLFWALAILPALAFALLPLALLADLESFDQRLTAPARWIVASLTLAALFVALLPYLSECVFWLTGGLVYVVPLLASLAWLRALTRQAWPNRAGPAALLLATLPVSLMCEQTSAALIAVAVLFAVLRKRPTRLYAVAVVLMIVGSIILVTAPGNAARATNGPHGLSYSPVALLNNYAMVMAASWARYVGPVIAGLAVGLVSAFLRRGTAVNRRGVAQWTLVMFAAAVSATVPLAAVPDFASSRTAFIPGAFLLVASAGGGSMLAEAFVANGSMARTLGISLATCLLAAYVGLAMLGWNEARVLRPQLATRWETFARATGTGAEVSVPRLTGREPLLFFAPDLSADPTYWANTSVADFFRLKSVRTVEH
jgi:Family of unknown function (DUF6056)